MANLIRDYFVKTDKKPFEIKKPAWKQVPLFKDSEIHDKHGNYGKSEVQ
jgi:hypothetical protein